MAMLVTLNDMKTYLGISGSTYDTFLTQQITVISDTIENYCRRVFAQATYVQTFYGPEYPPSKDLLLFMYPVISVTSVVEDGETVDTGDYRLNKPTGTIVKTSGSFNYGAEETVITYSAGFATIPTPLQDVVFSLVAERYNKKVAGIDLSFGSDVQRVSIPGTISVDFDYSLSNNDRSTPFGSILGNYLNSLDYYRSHRVAIPEGNLIYVG